uniref:Translin-associated factor X-interacting protein 1 N-terminal domain-containing protein n=1 Tax=Gopherus agassizii TaxID=38772 RepID=A0A452HR74_9SAUR
MFFSTKTILLFLVFCDIIISFTMAESKQARSLTHLLDGLEKAHRADVQLYTSGHLNHNNLYKPRENVKPGYWDSAKKPASFMTERKQLPAQNICKETAKKMKNSLADFTPSTTQVPVLAKSAFSIYRHSQALMASVDHPVNGPLTSTPLEKQLKELKKKTEEETDRLKKPLRREELDVPEMKVLKYKPVKNSRRCAAEVTKDEYQFMPSYLAGVTKTDQFNKFLHFQRDFIAKHDLLENDITGSKASERHERKLAQELQKICDCNRPHFKRLQVFGDVFEDICNSSLIFGDILKEVKNEYELYMVILLDSLPTTQYQTLMAQVKGMGKRPVKTQEIEAIRREVQTLVKKAKSVLERNEELRNELEIHVDLQKGCLIESMRCQVLAKWEEMQAIEKEIRETMTHAGMANTVEKTVKDIEAEALKLNSANSFLQHQIKVSSFFRTVIWSKPH